jgi:hypothetical protein
MMASASGKALLKWASLLMALRSSLRFAEADKIATKAIIGMLDMMIRMPDSIELKNVSNVSFMLNLDYIHRLISYRCKSFSEDRPNTGLKKLC